MKKVRPPPCIAESIEKNWMQSNYWCSIAEHNQTSIEHKKICEFQLFGICNHNRTITSHKVSLTKMVLKAEFIGFNLFSSTTMSVHRARASSYLWELKKNQTQSNAIEQNKSIKTIETRGLFW